MLVHTGPDSALKFYWFHKGLYYFDTSDPKVLNPFVNAYYLIITTQEKNISLIETKSKERKMPELCNTLLYSLQALSLKEQWKATSSGIFP